MKSRGKASWFGIGVTLCLFVQIEIWCKSRNAQMIVRDLKDFREKVDLPNISAIFEVIGFIGYHMRIFL